VAAISRATRIVALVLLASFSAAPVRGQATVAQELKWRIEQLRVAGRLDVANQTILASMPLLGLYERSAFAPLWINPPAANDLVRVLRAVSADGLEPADYYLDAIEKLNDPRTSSATAELELLRTAALVRVAYDLRRGKVNAVSVKVWRDYSSALLSADPVEDIGRFIASDRLYDDVQALRPGHFVYRGLVEALSRLHGIERAGGWSTIPAGPPMARDSTNHRVPLLRHRLVLEGDLPRDSAMAGPVFDAALEKAIKSFQHRHALNADGVVGPGTLAELNVPVQKRIDQVRINLERARWVTHDLPDTFVAVNVAGAMVYYVRDGSVLFETRSVVGKTYTATPVFRAPMRYIELNPTWTVPPGIVGEILAAVRRDPGYLRAQNMHVLTQSGREIDAATIDFTRYTGRSFPYVIRQSPGPLNPLGRIKLMFPNQFNVYLHDTPARTLFDREERMFSHGCIRVQDPVRLAGLVLNDSVRWSKAALDQAIATGVNRTITLERPLPVLILYWTASADLHGELHFYRDVYGRDPALFRALNTPT
jgi:L,D-transpeptidase YcbB